MLVHASRGDMAVDVPLAVPLVPAHRRPAWDAVLRIDMG